MMDNEIILYGSDQPKFFISCDVAKQGYDNEYSVICIFKRRDDGLIEIIGTKLVGNQGTPEERKERFDNELKQVEKFYNLERIDKALKFMRGDNPA